MGLFDPSLSPGRRPPEPKRGFLRRLPWDLRLLVLGSIYLTGTFGLLLAGAFVYYTATHPRPDGAAPEAAGTRCAHPGPRRLAADASAAAPTPMCRSTCCRGTSSMRCSPSRTGASSRIGASTPPACCRAIFTNLQRRPRRRRAARRSRSSSPRTSSSARERTLVRKLEELVLALWLEVRLGKRRHSRALPQPGVLRRRRLRRGIGRRAASSTSRARELTHGGGGRAGGPAQGALQVFAGLEPAAGARARRQRAGQDGGGRLLPRRSTARSMRLPTCGLPTAGDARRDRASNTPSMPCSTGCRT